jgi:hypothetical protein
MINIAFLIGQSKGFKSRNTGIANKIAQPDKI